jgi:hypothetical protein
MKELEELERLANTATQGPYELRQVDGLAAIATPKGWLLENGDEDDLPDKAYIAAASPDVILSLIRELKIARKALMIAAEGILWDDGVGGPGIEMYIKLAMKTAERIVYPETEQP